MAKGETTRRNLDVNLHRHVTLALKVMLKELQEKSFVVIDGRGIKFIDGKNPDWYQWLCHTYTQLGSERTKIKRGDIVKLLIRLTKGEMPESVYTDDLIDIAKDLIDEWRGKYECIST